MIVDIIVEAGLVAVVAITVLAIAGWSILTEGGTRRPS